MSKLSSKKILNTNHILIGPPNVGKSTIFNMLTTSTTIVSNIDRMTTDHTEGRIKKKKDEYLIDLPGIYNLSHPLDEEKEVGYHLIKSNFKSIVNVVSAFSIKRDLLLSLQCAETGKLNTMVINMIDTVDIKQIDLKLLSKKLGGTNIVLTRSNKKVGTNQIIKSIEQNKLSKDDFVKYSLEIENLIAKAIKILPECECKLSKRFYALMLLEGNEYFWKHLETNHKNQYDLAKKIIGEKNYASEIFSIRSKYIEEIFEQCGFNKEKYVKRNILKQNNFDKYFLKKWIGIPSFILIVLIIYYLSFGPYAGGWLQSHFADWLNNDLTKMIENGFNNIHCNPGFTNFFCRGLLSGLFIILPFIIPITILYFFIGIIQQIGLLSRVSVLLDNALSKFGLSGRGIINLFTGFGCNVPAIMLARSSSSKKERIVSILITPFVSCATRVIVISYIATKFYGMWSWLCVYGMIILSGCIALLIGLLFSNILFRKQKSFFCVEMVAWNGLNILPVLQSVWMQIKAFLSHCGIIIMVSSIVIWFLLNFGPTSYFMQENFQLKNSFLGYISQGVSYLLYPCFNSNNWQLTCALLNGLPAKEVVLVTMSQISTGSFESIFMVNGNLSYPLILSFIMFFTFYAPCVPTMAIIKKEIGWKYFWINIATGLSVAYILSTLSYWIAQGIMMVPK